MDDQTPKVDVICESSDEAEVFHDLDDKNDFEIKRHEKEWESLKSARTKEGYREGISQGQEDSLQDGFNYGYRIGFSAVNDIAKLRGTLWAVICIHRDPKQKEQSVDMQQLQNQVEQLTELERKLILSKREDRQRYCSTVAAPFQISGAPSSNHSVEDEIPRDIRNTLTEIVEKSKSILKELNISEWVITGL